MKIGVIGFGHLGRSLVEGLLYKKIVPKENIFIFTKSQNTFILASQEYGVNICQNINDLITKCDVIFFIIKSSVFEDVCSQINRTLLAKKLLVSFMAGITIKSIMSKLGNVHITRAMPSIAISKADGVIGYTPTNNEYIENIFHELGYAFEVKEEDIEKVTAFSACGIGFAAYILNAFEQTGKDLGFNKEVSQKIVYNTFRNALESSNYFHTMESVATKGGATEQGILHFNEHHLDGTISEAVHKALQKMLM